MWTNKKLIVVAQKGEGDYFGEVALVQPGAKRTAYIRCSTYCVVEKLTDDIFNDLIKTKHPRAYRKIIERIAKFHNIKLENLLSASTKGQERRTSQPVLLIGTQRRVAGSDA